MSYNLVDPTTGDLTRVAGNSNIVDTAIEIDSTWSSKKINDSLVNITDKLEEKVGEIPLIYGQNTDILAYALTCPPTKRTLVRIFSANASNNPFGVTSETDFIYEISKIEDADNWISIKAKDVRTNREFLNTKTDVMWSGWQELATMDKVAKIEEISNTERVKWTEQTNHQVLTKYILRNDGTQGIGLYVDGTLYAIIPFAKLSR